MEYNKDKYFIKDEDTGTWMHRTPLKLFVNPILRKIQFWTDVPFVIASKCIFVKYRKTPKFLGYRIKRVKFLKSYKPTV